MKALILSDLHYDDSNSESRKRLDAVLDIDREFDAVLLAGDNAELSMDLRNHRNLFAALNEGFDCPKGFVLGNHELWGRPFGYTSRTLLNKLFVPLADDFGITHLESENLYVGDTAFVGTYGHYDYSFFQGTDGITMDHIMRGKAPPKAGEITWEDVSRMDWQGKSHPDVCRELVEAFRTRLREAKGKKIASISHTIPDLALQGWPASPKQSFLLPYSGSTSIGYVLDNSSSEYHFCGHTHHPAQATIGKTEVYNLGSNGDTLRYAVLSLGRSDRVDLEEVIIA